MECYTCNIIYYCHVQYAVIISLRPLPTLMYPQIHLLMMLLQRLWIGYRMVMGDVDRHIRVVAQRPPNKPEPFSTTANSTSISILQHRLWILEKIAGDLKKQGFECYMIEEYPTADQLEVERAPLPLQIQLSTSECKKGERNNNSRLVFIFFQNESQSDCLSFLLNYL